MRTAAVAGTATAVSNRVSRRQGERWANQQAEAAPAPAPAQAYAAPVAAAPAAPAVDPIEQLKKLGELRDNDILTEEEFAAEKAKILAG